MRPAAPSLDILAAESARAREDQDSQSSSSTSSPAQADNEEESDFFLANNDSQSSLGVGNLQDMQVDDTCRSSFNRLPNEILISIFQRLDKPSELRNCMLTCKRWARNAVELLWHRPACTSMPNLQSITLALGYGRPYFAYQDFIKRLNLSTLADKVNDGTVQALGMCKRVERLTLTNCKSLTDSGLQALVENNNNLLALDISGDTLITERSILALAQHCRRLQGLNVSGCSHISSDSMIMLAESCKYLKRLKLNDCQQLEDAAIEAFAQHCRNILEIDLHQCIHIGNEPITSLLTKGRALRELRLANCDLISDSAFLSLPPNKTYDHLRILDLTACVRLTDAAVQKIIDVAPRLRNLVLAKCRNITDVAVVAISRLGKNLHYVHLGHCFQITDDAVQQLVQSCNRIRYIDLGCCSNLTDASVTRLATLPKLKRIGLVKCSQITDESVLALAKASHRPRGGRRDAHGNTVADEGFASNLERVHLSYCLHLTLKSVIRLLNACPRLTHLSLTGVSAFLHDEFKQFGRQPPPEFTEHQRQVFCVFSGVCVKKFREYLNNTAPHHGLRGPPTWYTVPPPGFDNVLPLANGHDPTLSLPPPPPPITGFQHHMLPGLAFEGVDVDFEEAEVDDETLETVMETGGSNPAHFMEQTPPPHALHSPSPAPQQQPPPDHLNGPSP